MFSVLCLCRTVEVYDPVKDCWAPGPAMPAACSFPAGASVGGSALVVEGAAHTAAVLAFDREKRVWAHRPRMITPRVNLAAAGLPGLLVAMVRGVVEGSEWDPDWIQRADCHHTCLGPWLVCRLKQSDVSCGLAALSVACVKQV